MKPSYQLKEAQLIKGVTHVNGATEAEAATKTRMMASDESCDQFRETLVSQLRQQHQYSMEEKGDTSRFYARNELLSALACLDELEKSITSVHHIPPKILSTSTAADVESIDSDQLIYLKAHQTNNGQNDSIKNNKLCNDILTKKTSDTDLKDSTSKTIKNLMERIKSSERSVLDVQKENNILKQSLQASVLENEGLKEEKHILKQDLKKANSEQERLKTENDRLKDSDAHQTCIDKIAALRSVARALECENGLLLDQIKFLEPRSDKSDATEQLKQKETEIKEITLKYEQKKTENVKLMDQIISIEQELETERIFGKNVMTRVSDLQETLDAVKHGKRSVEENLQLIVEQNETFQKKAYELEIEATNLRESNQKLEEQINENTSTTGALSTATDNLEQEIAMQASFYEDKIETMQREMNDRLEEMSVSQAGDAESVRMRYCDLFDEKANELHELRKEYEKQKVKLQEVEQRLADQEMMELENREKMRKSQKCHNEELDHSLDVVQEELTTLRNGTTEMEQELQSLRKRYDDLQLSYLNAIAHFKSRLCRVSQLDLSLDSTKVSEQTHQEEAPEEQEKFNENEASLTDSSNDNIHEGLRLSLSSCEADSSTDSSPREINSRSPNESDDDDSGIKVEISEATKSHEQGKENISKDGSNGEARLNGFHENECSNDLSDSDHHMKEKPICGTQYGTKPKCKIKGISQKRKNFAKNKR